MVVPLLPKPCNQNPDRQVYPVFDLAEIRNYFDPSVTFFTLMFLISLFFLPTRVKRAILHVTVEEKPQLFFVYNFLYITSLFFLDLFFIHLFLNINLFILFFLFNFILFLNFT